MHGFSLSLPPSRGMLEETASLFCYERVRVRESASPGPPVRESGSASPRVRVCILSTPAFGCFFPQKVTGLLTSPFFIKVSLRQTQRLAKNWQMTMTSPVKSLSIREGVDGSLGIYKKIKPGLYSSVADFWFDICVFVKCEGELNSCSGYILDVHKVQGEIRVSK